LCGAAGWAADAAALCRQGKALKDSGQLDAAAAAYQQAVRLDAQSDEAHWGLAWVYRKQDLTERAAAEFAKVLELTRDPARAQEARAALARMGIRPPAETAHRPAEARQGRRLVRVCAAADPVFRSLPGWEERLRARFAAAAGEISRQAPIDFALVSVEAWEPQGAPSSGMDIVRDLQARVPEGAADVVVGFIAERREAPPEGRRMEISGYTLGLAPCFTGSVVVSEVIASRDGQEWRVPEANLRENLVHELGHLFGAVHVHGRSVMRSEPNGEPVFDFDPLNLEVIKTCRWVDFSEHFASLSQEELERLVDLYGQLARGPASDDGVHFYRAAALTFLDRYEEAIAEYLQVLQVSPADAYTHVNVARLYERVGDVRQARTHWAIAAGLGKPPEVVQEAREALERLQGEGSAK
jgi:tetratricopeptide (TPR) repeat protein